MPDRFRRALIGAVACVVGAVALAAQAPGRGPDAAAVAAAKAAAQTAAAQGALIAAGFAQLDARAATMASIATRADAETRQASVRQAIGALVGGIPRAGTPRVAVTRFGSVPDD